MIYKRILTILLVVSLSIALSPIIPVFANEASVGLSQTISGKSVIKADGSLWNWNDNKPKKILDNVASISEGSNFTMALKADNTLWSWGNNEYGQLGDNMTANRLIPKMILEDVASVAASEYFALAIKTDDSLWAWGDNTVGQIGKQRLLQVIKSRQSEKYNDNKGIIQLGVHMKILNLNQTVNSATQKYPELIKVIVDLGFPQIRNNLMRNSLGKKFTLNQAIEKSGHDRGYIVNKLTSKGFSVVE